MTGSADAIAENRPTGERPSPIAWLAALCIPAAVLVASIGAHPQFFDVTIVQSDGQADSRGPVPLYRRGGATFYFTTADLLHPEAFGAPGAFIEAVAFDVVPATERGPDAGFPTWILQIARALKLQDADGHAIGAPSLQEADTKLLDELATVFVPGLTLRRGMTRSLALPEASTYRARSGLRVLTAMAVARGTAAPPSDGTDSLLGSALALAAKDVVNSGGTGLGVPCIPSLGGGNRSLCEVADWFVLLGQGDKLLRANKLRTLVYGGWGKTEATRRANEDSFRQAWVRHQGELRSESMAPAHEPLRLSALTTGAAFLGSFLFRRRFGWTRLLAIALLATGIGTSVGAALSIWQPLWSGVMSPSALLVVKSGLCVVAGLALERIAAFDARRVLQSDRP